MCNDRELYSFKRCMFFAWHDIRRVWKAYIIGDMIEEYITWSLPDGKVRAIVPRHRERCGWGKYGKCMRNELGYIMMEIKHGIFDQGK